MHRTIRGTRTATLGGTVIGAAIALLASSVSVEARSIDLQQRQRFEIPSEDLSAALTAFSAATDIHLVTSGVRAGVFSPGARGDLSTLNALTELLGGTGMSFRQVDADTIMVVPAQMARLRATQLQLVSDVSDQNALATAPTAAGAPAAAAPAELTEVQVTGTRIVREGYEAPTPVTAVGLQQLQDTANANIGDTLNLMPVFQGSVTNQTSTISNNSGTQTELNLRNLGAQRTLVLFDGRRLPSGNSEYVPNVDLIPDALVQRVDVVTGGASAVYGSDAVAGVVNYVLDTNFTGIKGLIQAGTSAYADGDSEKVSLTFGTTLFEGRLHLLGSADQSYQAEIPGYARGWNISQELAINNPAYKSGSKVPQTIMEPCCTTNPGYLPGGLIISGPLLGTDFGSGGTPGQYNYGIGSTAASQGDSGGDWQTTQAAGTIDIIASDNVQHYFARVGFDITDKTHVYAEFLNGLDHGVNRCCPDYYPAGIGTIYTNNPYLPASVATQAAALGVTSFNFAKTLWLPPGNGDGIDAPGPGMLGWGDIGGIYTRMNDVYVLGFKGELQIGKNSYNWQLYGQQGIAVVNGMANGSIKTNLSNAIEAVRVGSYGGTTAYTSPPAAGATTTSAAYTAANFPNPLNIPAGTITCASNLLPLSNPAATSNCAAYNIFGTDTASQAAINYTQGWATERQVYTQSILGGDITGEPFSTWAGPVSVAVDAEYRRDATDGNSDPNSRYGNWFSVNYFAFDAKQHVTEGAVETVVPLLKGVPFVQELDFNAGARATDYSISGYVTTYKYGIEYTPFNDMRVRASDSFDIRAPNLTNLYAMTSAHGTSLDPFTNTQVPTTLITGGNTSLVPEKAHQYEVGLVYQPNELPGLSLSADYYHIKLTGAIATLSTLFILQQCMSTQIPGTLTGTSPLCALITRNPNGTLNSVEAVPYNIAGYLITGVDYQADYHKNLTEWVSTWKGTAGLTLSATNTQHDITNTGIPGPTQVLEGAGFGAVPHWAVYGTLTYELDPWRFSWSERYDSANLASNVYIQCTNNCPTTIPTGFSTVNWESRRPAYFLANLNVTYKFMQHEQQEADAFISVNNLFNKIPPPALTNSFYAFSVNTQTALYDETGTYVHAGIRFRL